MEEEKKPDLTPEQIEQSKKILTEMHTDVHGLRCKILDLAIDLLRKWPKEEVEWMMKQAKEDEEIYKDPLAAPATQSIIEILRLANKIRDEIENGGYL